MVGDLHPQQQRAKPEPNPLRGGITLQHSPFAHGRDETRYDALMHIKPLTQRADRQLRLGVREDVQKLHRFLNGF